MHPPISLTTLIIHTLTHQQLHRMTAVNLAGYHHYRDAMVRRTTQLSFEQPKS
jgi:hypothetical protein